MSEDNKQSYKVVVRETRVVEVEYTIEAGSEAEAMDLAGAGETIREQDIRTVEVTDREVMGRTLQLAPAAPEGQQMFRYVVGKNATQYFKADVPFDNLEDAMDSLSKDGLECALDIEWDGSEVNAFEDVEFAEIMDAQTGETLAEYDGDSRSWQKPYVEEPSGP